MTRPATLITGASAGLGVEFARACARRGDVLALTARRADRLEALAAELGRDVHVLPEDLAEADAPDRLLAAVADAGLHVHTLINNAGFGLAGHVATSPPDRLGEMVDLNVRALVALSRGVAPGMVERGRGGILQVASTAAFQPGPRMAVYFATKAFVLSFGEALHQELAPAGVHVSVLCPGPTKTEFGAVAGLGPRFDSLTADAAGVVAAGLRGLARNQAVIVPGLANKLGTQAGRVLPRAAMRAVMGRIKL